MAEDPKQDSTPTPDSEPAVQVPPKPQAPTDDLLKLVIDTPVGGSGGMFSILDKLTKTEL